MLLIIKCAFEIGTGAMVDMPLSINIRSCIETHRPHGDRMRLLLFPFKIKNGSVVVDNADSQWP
jgi:hypothetical protein